jgi:colanic acid/amylovoran biosynthesis glycosyltransferase
MQVAYLLNQYPHPSCTFIRREIVALEQLGHTVWRLAIRRWPTPLVDPLDRDEQPKTRYVLDVGAVGLLLALLVTALTRPGAFIRALKMAYRLSRKADRGLPYHLAYLAEACVLRRWFAGSGAQHVHAHFGTNAAAVALLAHLLGGPGYSFTSHGSGESDQPHALHLSDKIAHARFVVAVSEHGKSQLYRWCPFEQWPKVHLVRCGVDAMFLKSAPTPAQPRLICVGRLVEQKGHGILIAAAAQLARRGVEFELVVVGDGPMRGAIEGLISRHSLHDRVKLLGWQSNEAVRRELLASRALVLPSFAEGLPVVIMESMALGRPVISTYVAGIPELVVPDETGWLVPAGNSAALADAMRHALALDPEALGALGRACAARVAILHDVIANTAALAKLFEATTPSTEARNVKREDGSA